MRYAQNDQVRRLGGDLEPGKALFGMGYFLIPIALSPHKGNSQNAEEENKVSGKELGHLLFWTALKLPRGI